MSKDNKSGGGWTLALIGVCFLIALVLYATATGGRSLIP